MAIEDAYMLNRHIKDGVSLDDLYLLNDFKMYGNRSIINKDIKLLKRVAKLLDVSVIFDCVQSLKHYFRTYGDAFDYICDTTKYSKFKNSLVQISKITRDPAVIIFLLSTVEHKIIDDKSQIYIGNNFAQTNNYSLINNLIIYNQEVIFDSYFYRPFFDIVHKNLANRQFISCLTCRFDPIDSRFIEIVSFLKDNSYYESCEFLFNIKQIDIFDNPSLRSIDDFAKMFINGFRVGMDYQTYYGTYSPTYNAGKNIYEFFNTQAGRLYVVDFLNSGGLLLYLKSFSVYTFKNEEDIVILPEVLDYIYNNLYIPNVVSFDASFNTELVTVSINTYNSGSRRSDEKKYIKYAINTLVYTYISYAIYKNPEILTDLLANENILLITSILKGLYEVGNFLINFESVITIYSIFENPVPININDQTNTNGYIKININGIEKKKNIIENLKDAINSREVQDNIIKMLKNREYYQLNMVEKLFSTNKKNYDVIGNPEDFAFHFNDYFIYLLFQNDRFLNEYFLEIDSFINISSMYIRGILSNKKAYIKWLNHPKDKNFLDFHINHLVRYTSNYMPNIIPNRLMKRSDVEVLETNITIPSGKKLKDCIPENFKNSIYIYYKEYSSDYNVNFGYKTIKLGQYGYFWLTGEEQYDVSTTLTMKLIKFK